MIFDFSALNEVFRSLPDDAAVRTAGIICAHQRIFVCGAGRTGLMMKALAMRLAQTGRVVYVVGETVTPAITAGDLLILASASGKTASICRYAEIARSIGAQLLIFTGASHSPLTEIAPADVCFDTPSKEDGANAVSLMGTLFEQALLLFSDQVILALNEDSSAMRARHANLE